MRLPRRLFSCSRSRIAISLTWRLGSGPKLEGFGLWVLGLRFWVLCLGFGTWALGFGLWVQLAALRFWVRGFGFCALQLPFKTSENPSRKSGVGDLTTMNYPSGFALEGLESVLQSRVTPLDPNLPLTQNVIAHTLNLQVPNSVHDQVDATQAGNLRDVYTT